MNRLGEILKRTGLGKAQDFVPHREHNGLCRVYYFKKGDKRRFRYCLQSDAFGGFQMYSCSRDGEPDCPINPDYIGKIEPCRGETDIGRELNKWLAYNRHLLNLEWKQGA